MFKSFFDYIVYLLACTLEGLIRLLPSSLAMGFGETIGKIFYLIDKRHRLVTHSNLKKALGQEKTPEELAKIAIGSFINLGLSLIEFCRFPSILTEENLHNFVEIEGFEHFKDAWEQGRGILVITAHYGNWELIADTVAILGYPSNIVIRPLDNPYVEKLVTNYRSHFGNKFIPKKKAIRKVLHCLKNGECTAMLIDQSTAPREAVKTTFFGHPCYTVVSPVMLALKTNCALIPVFIIRQEKNKHKLVFLPEVIPVRTDDRQSDLQTNTQRLNDIIEDFVRRHPDHWLWMHRRWKV